MESSKRPLRIILAAGGGGHFAPALAVLEKLPKETEVLLVGRKQSLEGDQALSLEYITAKSHSIPFASISTGRLQRTFTKHTIFSLLKTPVGFYQAFVLLKKFKPDVLLSFGGYISVPVVLAGAVLGVPIVLHEQTTGVGTANKVAARFAKKICISHTESAVFFPKDKTVFTGNPIRSEIRSPVITDPKLLEFLESSKGLPLLFVTGGSLGSHSINIRIEGCLFDLLETFRIVHQTGDARNYGDFDRLMKRKEGMGEKKKQRYFITKFIDPMSFGGVLREAEIVVGRAGANTVSELLLHEKPSLLIPLPFAQKNEQMKNALLLKNVGLAEILTEEEADEETLFAKIVAMHKQRGRYTRQRDEEKELPTEDASKKIIDVLYSVANA